MALSVAWVVLTVADIYPYLQAKQVDLLREGELTPQQSDPFEDIMPYQAARLRTAIAANQRNKLSATANAIPPECKWVLVWLVLEQMLVRIPQLELSEDQKSLIKDAKAELDRIRDVAKAYPISVPVDPESSASQTVQPTLVCLNEITRLATREYLAGL